MRSGIAARGMGRFSFALMLTGLLLAQPASAQPSAPPDSEKPDSEKPAGEQPAGEQPAGEQPAGEQPAGEQPAGERPAPSGNGATAPPETTPLDGVPINIRLRRLEQRVQALKERAWRAKARVGMLKEAVIGGGVGASATIVHRNRMGKQFRLVKLVYGLDGTQIFARSDESGSKKLYNQKSFDVLTGPVAPGSHTVSVLAVYRGHGYGVFKYIRKYRFTVRSSHTFSVTEGKATRIEVNGFSKGGPTTPLEKRPALDFKVSHGSGSAEKK